MDVVQEKECFKCHEIKSLDSFYKHPQMADSTYRLLNSLTAQERQAVDRLVIRHLKAVLEAGTPLGSLDTLYVESVEAVQIMEKDGKTSAEVMEEPIPDTKVKTKYEQYKGDPRFL